MNYIAESRIPNAFFQKASAWRYWVWLNLYHKSAWFKVLQYYSKKNTREGPKKKKKKSKAKSDSREMQAGKNDFSREMEAQRKMILLSHLQSAEVKY